MNIKIILITALLVGCIDDNSSNSSSNSNSVDQFDISSYQEKSLNTSTETMLGTWVGATTIKRERHDAVNASVTPRLDSNLLEFFVIRQGNDELEISTCGSGFESAEIINNQLISYHRILNIVDQRLMKVNNTSSRTVPLGNIASYSETTIYSADFIKISDQSPSFGTITQNWSDSPGDIQRDIYCAKIENIQGNYRRVSVGSDNNLIFTISNIIDPSRYESYISDPSHNGDIKNYLTMGEQEFSFSIDGPDQFLFDYNATSAQGLGVSGHVNITMPAQ